MSKKSNKPRSNAVNLPRQLENGLWDAENLLDNSAPQEALNILRELNKKYPNNLDVLSAMTDAYADLKDVHGYLHAIYKVHKINPNHPDIKLGLAGGYLSNERMALALKTFREFLKRWPSHKKVPDVLITIKILEAGLTEILQKFDLTLENGMDFACMHEEMQIKLESGEYYRCIQLGKKLLKQQPEFVPILNNLSLAHWLEGNLALAVQTAQQVLVKEADNIHALSNLVRFSLLLGDEETALQYARALKASKADASERWSKIAEALTYIGDFEGVLALLEEAQKDKQLDLISAPLWHLFAVAEYRSNHVSKARSYWKKCLKLAPYYSLAVDNLEELSKPSHERDCPQVFSQETWLTYPVLKTFFQKAEPALRKKGDKPGPIYQELNPFLEEHPEILNAIPIALSDGDSAFKKTALIIAEMLGHPKALEYLKEFALGKEGPDDLRLKAAQTLAQHGVFKSGEQVELWRQGELHPILMLGFEISDDVPDDHNLKPSVEQLSEQAAHALRNADFELAEEYLRKALQIQPDHPSLLNNLAFSLNGQEKHKESDAILKQINDQYPDYFFGRVAAIHKAIRENDLETADMVLNLLMQKKRLHFSEFSALCACQIEFSLSKNEYESADSWFNIWKQVDPDDPAQEKFEEKIEIVKVLSTLQNKIGKKAKKPSKSIDEQLR
jgi:tetratricopeptide (TPR) repeat protein